jgi:hypothetical protein
MMNLLEKVSDNYIDGIVCENENQIEKIWKIREAISLATAHHGLVNIQFLITI